jgi:hypothetical protein
LIPRGIGSLTRKFLVLQASHAGSFELRIALSNLSL